MRNENKSKLLNIVRIGLATGMVCLSGYFGSGCGTVKRNPMERKVIDPASETNVYEGPGKNYRLKGALSKGDEIKVLGMTEAWIQCSSGQYEIGWVRKNFIDKRTLMYSD